MLIQIFKALIRSKDIILAIFLLEAFSPNLKQFNKILPVSSLKNPNDSNLFQNLCLLDETDHL
jgi:hypothetical protein